MLVSNIGCVIYFGIRLNGDIERGYIAEYKLDVCNPIAAFITPLICDAGKSGWLPTWKDSLNRTMVIDPFSTKSTRLNAIAETKEVELFSNHTCMCRSKDSLSVSPSNCQTWETCILNVRMIDYFQRDYTTHFKTNLSFVVTSSLSIILTLSTLPMSIRLFKSTGSTYVELS